MTIMLELPIKSFKAQSLRKILFTAFALIFTLPLLIFFYIAEHFNLLSEQLIHISIIGFLVFSLMGFILLRQIIDQIIHITTGSENLLGDKNSTNSRQEGNELFHLTKTFETLASTMKENTEKLSSRIDELSSLRELSEFISKSVDYHQLFEKVLEKLMVTTNSSLGMMLSLSDDKKTLTVEATRGIDKISVNRQSFDADKTIAGSVLTGSMTLISNDAASETAYNPEIDGMFTGPFIAKAVTARGRIIGVLNLSRGVGDKPYGRTEIDYITTALGQIASALDNAELIHELKASNDKLREMQKKLVTFERAAAVNQTVVTLSDQINSPLMVIQGHAELIKKRFETSDSPVMKSLDAIGEASKKCVDIMNKLRNIREPAVKDYSNDGTKMIDIEQSMINSTKDDDH